MPDWDFAEWAFCKQEPCKDGNRQQYHKSGVSYARIGPRTALVERSTKEKRKGFSMISVGDMTQIIISILWVLLICNGIEIVGHFLAGFLVLKKYRWSFWRSMFRYSIAFFAVILLLRLPETKLAQIGAFFSQANPYLLILFALLLAWGSVVATFCVLVNRWAKRIFWMKILKKTACLLVLDLAAMILLQFGKELLFYLPAMVSQKWISLMVFLAVIAAVISFLWHDFYRFAPSEPVQRGYFLACHFSYRALAGMIVIDVAYTVFAKYWFG